MKSLLTKISSVLAIFTLCVGMCACANPTSATENCDSGHNLVQQSYTTPTCQTSGQRIYKCSRCDYMETETLLPIDHAYQTILSTPSTCSTHGSETVKCSMCYKEVTSQLPLLNHNYELTNVKTSTCTIEGVKNYKCKDCGDTYSQELELLRHNYKTVNTSTCFADGELKNVCDDCQHEEVIEDKPMLTHEFADDGYCAKCGIYETLFDEAELGVTWKAYQGNGHDHVFDDIHGYLKPKFNNGNTIPDEYFIDHTIFINLSFYNEDNELLESKEFSSFIIPWDGFGHKGKPTIQFGGSTNGFAYEFMLRFWLQKAFEESTLQNADSFKIELSCEGYKTITKTYNLPEVQ